MARERKHLERAAVQGGGVRSAKTYAFLVATAMMMAVVPSAMAAPPTAVVECTYNKGSTAEKPCTGDLYVGDFMTFECSSGHTAEPVGVQASAKYCATAVPATGSCGKTETLDKDIGVAVQDSAKVILRLSHTYTEKFKDVISYNIRCDDGAGKKNFVSLKLWPFTKPMTVKPRLSCENNTDDFTNGNLDAPNQIFCHFYSFKADNASVDCRETSQTGSFIPTDAYTNSTGNVCTTGYTKQVEPACLSNTKDTWANVVAGAAITATQSNQMLSINSSAQTVARSTVFIGCTRSGGGGGKKLFTQGVLYNHDFVAVDAKYVPMIKHVCTPEKGKAIGTPCEVTLDSDEAVVIACTPFAADPSSYKMMPADSGSADGSFCGTMPKSFSEDCKDTKKWKDTAYTEVVTDATKDFFIISLPKANADKLKSRVTAHGYCSDGSKGLAWKVMVGKDPSAGGGNGGGGPGAGSAAPPSFPGSVVIAVVTLVGASLLSAAIM